MLLAYILKERERERDDAYLITDQASECNILTSDIGLGEDASSIYLERPSASQVEKPDKVLEKPGRAMWWYCRSKISETSPSSLARGSTTDISAYNIYNVRRVFIHS